MLKVKDGVGSNASTATALQTARTINGTSFNGTANITTANWGTARTLTIGNTGKSVNGSGNVSWSLTEIGAASISHSHATINYTNLSSQTISLNNLNLSSGFESISYFCCPTDGGGSGITGRPDDNNKTAFNLKVELLRWASTTDYISKQTYTRANEKVSYVRYCTNGTWSAWEKIYTSANKPTVSEIGAAASSHTHNYAGSSSAGGAATTALACSGNSATATKLATARTINGVSFDGTNNITITAAANGGTSSSTNYMNVSTRMDYGWNGMNYFNINGTAGSAAKANDTPSTAWWHVMRFNHANSTGYYTDLAIPFNDVSLYYKRITGGSVQNGGWIRVLDALNYNSYAPTKTGGGASGTWGISVTGNASTATTLQTARTINGTSFNGSANITTANWGTARTITIGNTGKSVNGSGNISWSLSEIGAAAASHSHSYLPLSGGTMTGRITANGRVSVPTAGSSWISGATITNASIGISTTQSTGSYHPILAVKSSSGHTFNIGGLGDNTGFYGFKSGRTENGTDWSFTFNVGTGAVTSTGNITAPTFVGVLSGNASTATKLATARTINGVSFDGSANITITAAANGGTSSACSGNAATATKLQTARTINGTSFNGSANITTANWGTARTITIGNTAKSVNGSGNVSWTLAEIGAAATHSHPYLSTSGGTISGSLKTTSSLSVGTSASFGDTITIGSYDSDWKCVMINRATNGQNYAGKYGVSYLSSVKLTSSDTAAMAYGAGIECYNGSTAIRRVLISQHSFIPMADNNMYCGTSSHRWQALYASTGTVYSSSKDEKENITPLNIAPMSNNEKSIKDVIKNGIKNTNMYSYSYRTISNNDTFVGFLGQELEKQNPEFFNLIGSSYITEEGNQQYDIRETSVIGVLWSALQDAIIENEQQEERIKKLEEQVTFLLENK